LAVSKIKAIMDMPFYSVKDHDPKDPKPKKNDLILCYWTELEDRKDKNIVDESISGYYFARVSKPVRDGAVFFSVIFVSTGQELRLTRLTARNGKRKRILPIYDYIKSQKSEFLACNNVRKEFTKKFEKKTPEQKCVWNFMYKYRNRLKLYTKRLEFKGFKMIAKESKDMNAVKALLSLGEDGDQKKAPSSSSDTESEEEEMYKDMGDEYEVMLRKLKF